jgi:hypothetical protein
MIRDIDVMLCESALPDALPIIEALGYRVTSRDPPGHSGFGELVRPGSAGSLDLRVAPVDAPEILGAAEVWHRACPVNAGGATVWVPHTDHRILQNVLRTGSKHAGRSDRAGVELRQIYDLALLAQGRSHCADWQAIQSRLRQAGLHIALESQLLTAHRLFGLPWPLPHRPGWRAVIQHQAWMFHILVPAAARAIRSWGNLRADMAGRRARGGYRRDTRNFSVLRDGWEYAHKHEPQQAMAPVARTD